MMTTNKRRNTGITGATVLFIAASVFSILLFSLLTISLASATVFVNNQFVQATYDTNNNLVYSSTPVTDVNVLGYACADASCSQVTSPLFNGQTLNSGAASTIQTDFPTQPLYNGNFGYAVFYYKDGYIPAVNNPNYFGSGTVAQTFTRPLTKITTCSAPIDSFAVINDVYPNQPIMVSISASADATVQNLLGQQGPIAYIPPVIAALDNLNVQVTLQIMNSAGQVVNTQQQSITLPPSGSVPVQFTFTPTTVDRYTARVSTSVADNKCLATDVQFSQKNFNVIAQNGQGSGSNTPTNMCYTLFNNLNVQPINQIVGQPVSITFNKISNYYDGSSNLFSLPTTTTVTVEQNGQTVWTQQINMPANPGTTAPQLVSAPQFIPTSSGYYTVSVSGTATSCPYNNNTADSVSQQFFIAPANNGNNTGGGSTNPNQNTPPQFTQLPGVRLFYNQGVVNNLFNLNNYATDADGDALTFSLVSQSNPATVSCSLAQNGAISCMTGQNQIGCSTVAVGASDGKVTSDSSFQACVLAPNSAPIFRQLPNATLPNPNTGGGSTHILRLLDYAFDPDGQALTFTIPTQTNTVPVNCVVDINSYMTCTGDMTKTGFSDITVVASDGSLNAASTFRITVNPQLSQAGSCVDPNGNAIANGTTATYYLTNTVPFGQTCLSQPRSCTNGVLSGSFTFTSCSVSGQQGQSCTGPNGATITSGSSATYYQLPSVPFGQSCASEQRSCNNGVLSGSYSFASCTPNQNGGNNGGGNGGNGASCVGPNNVTIVDGASATYFRTGSVPLGSVCASQSRTCNNGALSGNYTFAACRVSANTPPVWTQIPQFTIVRNTGNGSLNLAPFTFDPDVPPQVLAYSVDYKRTAFANQSAIISCSIAANSSILTCFTNHGQDGEMQVFVNVSDGINSTQTPVDVTVGIKKVSSRPPTTDGLRIMQFIVPDETVQDLAVNSLPITVSIVNDGHGLPGVTVSATLLELGLQTIQGPFGLGTQPKNLELYLPVDVPIKPGTYTIQLVVSDQDNGVNRIQYRDLIVYP